MDRTLAQCLCPSQFSETTAEPHRRTATRLSRRERSTEVGRLANNKDSRRSHLKRGRALDSAKKERTGQGRSNPQLSKTWTKKGRSASAPDVWAGSYSP